MSRRKGWRKSANTVYVGRPGRFGNPFPVEQLGRDEAIRRYEEWIQEPEQTNLLNEAKLMLRTKNLGCWRRPRLPFHADVVTKSDTMSSFAPFRAHHHPFLNQMAISPHVKTLCRPISRRSNAEIVV